MKKELHVVREKRMTPNFAESENKHLEFIKKCEVYIGRLKAGDNLVKTPSPKCLIISRAGKDWQILFRRLRKIFLGRHSLSEGGLNIFKMRANNTIRQREAT